MTIPNTIQDRHTASMVWLKKRLELDELNLPDYPRPTKVIKEKGKSPFQSQVARYGFCNAVMRFVAP